MYLRERYYEGQETTLEKETDAETDSKASGEDDSESSDTQSTLADIGSESTEPREMTEGQNTEPQGRILHKRRQTECFRI